MERLQAVTPAASSIRAVTFDIGGTLIEPWPSVGHVYAEVAGRFGHRDLEPDALNRQFIAAWKARREFDYSKKAWRELVVQTFSGLSPEPPGRECFEAMYEAFAEPQAWRIFDDVLPALAALRQRGFRLGVISNWDERLRPLLGRMQLSDRFDSLVISHEAGCTKPSPEIFRQAATALGTPPASILHVGDSVKEDVEGASAVGFQAILLDRRASKLRSGVTPGLDQLPLGDERSNPASIPISQP